MNGAFVGGMICGFVVVFGIILVIATAILKLSISVYNSLSGAKTAGPKAMVPDPSFGLAMGMVVICFIVNIVFFMAFGFILTTIVGLGEGAELNESAVWKLDWGIQLVSMAVTMAVECFVLKNMLPTSIDKAALVTICHTVVTYLIVFAFYACLFGMLLAIGVGVGLS